MTVLRIEATKSSPMIEFNAEMRCLQIKGESYPEDAAKFYNPVIQWVKEYLAQQGGATLVEIKMAYLNTSSSKCIMTFLDLLEDASCAGSDIAVKWHYDVGNEIALECGREFGEDLELPYQIIQDEE